MKISERRMTMYANRFLAYFDKNQRMPVAIVVVLFCAFHGLPVDEQAQLRQYLQNQGIL